MTNNQMIEGRFHKWFIARRMVGVMQRHLDNNGTVLVCTYTKSTRFSRKHRGMLKATKSGSYMQSGKRWVCVDYCKIILE